MHYKKNSYAKSERKKDHGANWFQDPFTVQGNDF